MTFVLAIILVAQTPVLSATAANDVTPATAATSQHWPAIAAGAGEYLVVWQDGLSGYGRSRTRIMGARVSATGQSLDAGGFVIADKPGFREYPTVAFDGEAFVVAWQDFRSSVDWDLYGSRVTPGGVVLDPGGAPLVVQEGSQVYPHLASHGSGTSVLVWSDIRPSAELYALRARPIEGQLTEAAGQQLTTGTGTEWLEPRVTWSKNRYVVTAVAVAAANSPWMTGSAQRMELLGDGTATPPQPVSVETFCTAADPDEDRQVVLGNRRMGHGAYASFFFLDHVAGATVQQSLVTGLFWHFYPRVELLCAAIHDGKRFVVVQEHAVGLDDSQPNATGSYDFNLVAFRVEPATGVALDVGQTTDAWDAVGSTRQFWTTQPAGVAVASGAHSERQPAIASLGAGSSLVVYVSHQGPERRLRAVVLSE